MSGVGAPLLGWRPFYEKSWTRHWPEVFQDPDILNPPIVRWRQISKSQDIAYVISNEFVLVIGIISLHVTTDCWKFQLLKLMTAAINRRDQCIPWSVSTRQLDSQHLCGDLSTDALQLIRRCQTRHWKLWVLSSHIAPTGEALHQCKELSFYIHKRASCLWIQPAEHISSSKSTPPVLVMADWRGFFSFPFL